MKTATAIFDTFEDANRAVNDLLSSGFGRDEVSLVSSNAKKQYDPFFDKEGRYTGSVVPSDLDTKEREMVGTTRRDRAVVDTGLDRADGSEGNMTAGEGAAAGAGIGAALGGVGGVLMGLGLLAIPGVGPALAAGAIVSGLVGAGIGGAAGGITGALANAGVPKEEVEIYAEGVRRGGHLVVVSTTDEKEALAKEVLQRNNPVSMRERAAAWRDEGWTGFDPNATPYDPDRPASRLDDASAAERERLLREQQTRRM